jgi:hypothetical protein
VGTPLNGQIWVTPRSVLAYFFCYYQQIQHSKTKWIFEFKALATDMAFASTHIKAGIDLFFLSQTKSFKCHFNHDTIQYQVTKVNKTLTNNRVFKK